MMARSPGVTELRVRHEFVLEDGLGLVTYGLCSTDTDTERDTDRLGTRDF